ncbi:hypothetical protein ASF30_13690 [Leifsonia sp. Leaf264]|nr:hypothetical protein ASF30_13690 [Leifsonia sp. Leaf264]
MLRTAVGLNWAGTYQYQAAGIAHAESIPEVQRLVADADRIRTLGTRHSFNDLADTTGTLVTVTSIPADVELDPTARTVTVGAGTRYGVLADFLEERGWALHNMGSLPHISVGGAISTGTHGSGNRNGNLSTAVRALTFVGPDGDLRTVRKGDPDFGGSVIALGALGVLVRVTLAIEPSYLVRQDVYRGLHWNELLPNLLAVTASGYSVSIFTDWVSEDSHVWVKQRVDSVDVMPAPDLFGATLDHPSSPPLTDALDSNLTEFGIAGPWAHRLPHFRLDATPSVGSEIQTEYFVDLDIAAAALQALRPLGGQMKPHLVGTELRTTAADELWLSPAHRQPVLGIHFTWHNHPDAVAKLLPQIEQALVLYGGRTHWGKLHHQTAGSLIPLYERIDDMWDLIARTDPGGKFTNDHLDRVLRPR